jgi:hypothetical protein
MHDGVLALRARERADGRHGPAAIARAIAGRLAIDVTRVQASGAVVAVLTSIQRPSYERPAAPAAKLVAGSLKAARSPLISIALRHGVRRLSRRPLGRPGDRGRVAIRLTMCRARTVGVRKLQLLGGCRLKRWASGRSDPVAACRRRLARGRGNGSPASSRREMSTKSHRRRCVRRYQVLEGTVLVSGSGRRRSG